MAYARVLPTCSGCCNNTLADRGGTPAVALHPGNLTAASERSTRCLAPGPFVPGPPLDAASGRLSALWPNYRQLHGRSTYRPEPCRCAAMTQRSSLQWPGLRQLDLICQCRLAVAGSVHPSHWRSGRPSTDRVGSRRAAFRRNSL